MSRPLQWLRLAKDDYRPASQRGDLDMTVLRGADVVSVARPRAGRTAGLADSYQAASVPIARFRDGILSGEEFHVFTSRRELVRESVVRRSLGETWLDEARRSELGLAKLNPGTAAVLGTPRAANYFHWWLDSVARVWLVHQVHGSGGLLWVGPSETTSFQAEATDLLGLECVLSPVLPRPQAYRELVFTPGLAFGAAQAVSPLVAQFAGYLQGRVRPHRRDRRVYVSRGAARTRKVRNEAAVVRALAAFDFEEVSLEGLPVAEQARVFAEASMVVGMHGAGLTNILFARPGTALIELFPAGGFHSSCYRHMASLLGLPYAAVTPDAAARAVSELVPGDQDVPVQELEKVVHSMLLDAPAARPQEVTCVAEGPDRRDRAS